MASLLTMRTWFALAVAVLSAAVCDPLLEAASNRGLFGAGSFTDHSNADVVPAMLIGFIAIALHLLARVRSAQRELRIRPHALLIPTFLAQMAVLFSMETIEQLAVYGHGLGGTIWLGAPAAISLLVHALTCIAVFKVALCTVNFLANATLDVIEDLRAVAIRPTLPSFHLSRTRAAARLPFILALHAVSGRAPPAYAFV